MRNRVWFRGSLLIAALALVLGVLPAAPVTGECDAECDEGTDALTGEKTDVCGKVEEGESGAYACYTELVPKEQPDGSIEFEPQCTLIWGPCEQSDGIWGYPIA